MAVAAHDYEIDVGIGCVREQRVGNVEVAVVDALDLHFKSVTREVLAHISAFDLILLAAFVGDDDFLDDSCPLKQWHGVGDRARGGSAAVPDAVKLERRFLDVGHDDDRPARIEQGGFEGRSEISSGRREPTIFDAVSRRGE